MYTTSRNWIRQQGTTKACEQIRLDTSYNDNFYFGLKTPFKKENDHNPFLWDGKRAKCTFS